LAVFLDIQMPGGSGFDLLRKLDDPPGHQYLVRRSLKEWEAVLPAEYFVALDRSVLIGWQHFGRWQPCRRKICLYMGRSMTLLELGRAAAHRFKTEVVPRIESRERAP
jgi:DNA-binding LytR/AlgR family response regulator